MTMNRDNVVWQSSDGRWNIGFWDYCEVDPEREDFDPEWDVEYLDSFHWVSRGHGTEEEAIASWRGANPGAHEVCPHSSANAAECARYDALAEQYAAAKLGARQRPSNR